MPVSHLALTVAATYTAEFSLISYLPSMEKSIFTLQQKVTYGLIKLLCQRLYQELNFIFYTLGW